MTSLASGLPGTMASLAGFALRHIAVSCMIQPQLAFARVVVHAVAGETLLCEHRVARRG